MPDKLFIFRMWDVMMRSSYNRMMTAVPWKVDIPVEDLVERWAVPPSKFIDVKGQKVHVRDEGPGDDPAPIVLIHGTSSSLQTWEGWVEALKEDRRLITFDLPGFGLTGPNARDDYRVESYVRFVLDLLDTLRVNVFVVGGNSLGGDIAWHLAVAAPQRVRQLILVDAAGYPMPRETQSVSLLLSRIPVLNQLFTFSISRRSMESGLKKLYGDPSRVTREVVDRHMQLMLRQGNRRALMKAIEQSNIGADAALIKTVKQPALIIWGGRDRLIPPDRAERFYKDIAGSRLEIFDELGHMPQEEDPEITVAALRGFLKIRKTEEDSLDRAIRQSDGRTNKWKWIAAFPARVARWVLKARE